MRKEVLAKLSDDQIVSSWREVVAQQKGAVLPTPQPINPQELQFQVQRMGTAELQQLLILLGMKSSYVQTLSEAKLRELVLDTLMKRNSTP